MGPPLVDGRYVFGLRKNWANFVKIPPAFRQLLARQAASAAAAQPLRRVNQTIDARKRTEGDIESQCARHESCKLNSISKHSTKFRTLLTKFGHSLLVFSKFTVKRPRKKAATFQQTLTNILRLESFASAFHCSSDWIQAVERSAKCRSRREL